MKNIKSLLLGSAICVLFSGCAATAQTTVYPMSNGSIKAISTSSDQHAALQDNIQKAQQYCAKRGMSFAVISQKETYNGIDKNVKQAANIAAEATFLTSDNVIPTGVLSNDDDNQVLTLFKCVSDQPTTNS